MNPVPASIGAPGLPQVNLLPAEVGQRRARGRARLAVMGVAGLLLLALGAVVFLAYSQKAAAQTKVDDLALRNTDLQAEQASYAYVLEARERKDYAVGARQFAGLFEVEIAPLLLQVREVMPLHTYIWSIYWDLTTVDGAAASESNAFAVPDLGSITMTLRSDYPIDAADVVDGVDSIPGLARTTVDTITVKQEEEHPTPDDYWLATAEELKARNLVTDVTLPAGLEIIPGIDNYFEMTLTTRIDLDALSLRFSDKWFSGLEANGQAHTAQYEQSVAAAKELRDAIIARARGLGTPTPGAEVSPTPTPEGTN